ncbi:MAG: tRNA (guanine-N(7)-)-methyltransferase non-catalytic subunit trm82 [Claussenomyces sp. TS43310]|nr:MAG: tRNA (guanine-N(7)-)-methyltransferase non-catalytic subunit trm82 [Claussenomyces sp. TS43310]
MHYAYQCMHICGDILIAARISHIDTFSLKRGSRLSSWSCPLPSHEPQNADTSAEKVQVESSKSSSDSSVKNLTSVEPAVKRRKCSSEHDSPPTLDKSRKQSKLQHSEAQDHDSSAPNITALAVTTDGRHVIVVTGDDKTIRVLKHDLKGSLQQCSKRAMPKRPCAITLTADDLTIVCADKFGDVYSLPISPETSLLDNVPDARGTTLISLMPQSYKPFVSAANDLTIHTARNRRALQNQLRQDQRHSEKSELQFEHKLLLGHVSMLTDIRLIERDGRSYIITADRDEHIRVSRGIPQAHVIETYCLGHVEFVAQLCLPPTHPSLLLSGGGDNEVLVWDWLDGKLLQKIDLQGHVEKIMESSLTTAKTETSSCVSPDAKRRKIAVSGICHSLKRSDQDFDTISVICEGVPALFFFSLSEHGKVSHYYTCMLDGNPLKVISDTTTGDLIVSVDSVHVRGSTTNQQAYSRNSTPPLQAFHKEHTAWARNALLFETDDLVLTAEIENECNSKQNDMSSLLYNFETLRKRGPEE